MKNTILITGGLGFIGSNVILHLLKTTKYSFLAFDKVNTNEHTHIFPDTKEVRRRVQIVHGDILKKKSIQQAVKEASIVIHMAAYTHASRSVSHAVSTITTNVLGTTFILDAIEKYPVDRFIYYSSSEVYGNHVQGILMDEQHPLNPITPYAASKLAGDRIAHAFFLSKQLPIVIVRPFNAYGPRQHPQKMIPLFITRLLHNLPITLNNGGKQRRDWVYIEDHARAIERVIKAPLKAVSGQVFNIGTGTSTTVADVAKLIIKILNKDEKKFLQINHSILPETQGNVGISTRLKNALDWQPVHTLSEGLEKTIDWYKKYPEWAP